MVKANGRQSKKTIIQNNFKKGAVEKVERKKTIVTSSKAKVMKGQQQNDDDAPPHRRSEFVGVRWCKKNKKWHTQVASKSLGFYLNEEEAARLYDSHVGPLGRPVNFPLHEGQQKAVKPAMRGTLKVFDIKKERPSKYVGVSWNKQMQKWEVYITIIKRRSTHVGYYDDEKEAARAYDEQAILLGKPVNFPLHEGMEQAMKQAPKGFRSNLPIAYRPSKYKGVSWKKKYKVWASVIVLNDKKTALGTYDDEEEAARAYDDMAAVYGRPVNFPLFEGQKQAVKQPASGCGKPENRRKKKPRKKKGIKK